MKYKLSMKLFFGPSVLTRLIDVKYDFKDEALLLEVESFKVALKKTEKRLNEMGLTYLRLDQIANSIQF